MSALRFLKCVASIFKCESEIAGKKSSRTVSACKKVVSTEQEIKCFAKIAKNQRKTKDPDMTLITLFLGNY